MHNPYDHLGKTIGCSALRACGPTEMEAVIAPDPRRADLRHEARALLTVLRGRGIVVPDAARERIMAETDAERLERWVERALVATSVAEVIDEPSQAA